MADFLQQIPHMTEVNSSWPKTNSAQKNSNVSFSKRKFCHDHLSNLKLLSGQVPRDPEDPQGAERQKEAQRLIDEAEPLNEEEVTEKEQLLQEVHLV